MSEILADSEGRYRLLIEMPDNQVLTIIAKDVRNTYTGIHADVGFILSDSDSTRLLDHDVFNIGRAEDRQRLVKRAHSMLTKAKQEALPLANLLRIFAGFSVDLDTLWRQRFKPVRLKGARREGGIAMALKPFIIEGGGTVFFGPPGAGKSYLGLLMAVSLSYGIRRFWDVERPIECLYINLERSEESIAHRLALVNKVLGLPEDSSLPMLNARGQSLKAVEESAQAAIREYKTGVMFLDSISRTGIGSLKEDETGNAIIDMVNRLCHTWVAIGHTPRDDGSHNFGSIMLDAGEDIGVQVASENQGTKVGILLQIKKGNDVPTGIKEYYALEFDPSIGLIGFRAAQRGEFIELAQLENQPLREQVKNYLIEVGDATATDIANALKRNRGQISALLNADALFVKTRSIARAQYFGVHYEG